VRKTKKRLRGCRDQFDRDLPLDETMSHKCLTIARAERPAPQRVNAHAAFCWIYGWRDAPPGRFGVPRMA